MTCHTLNELSSALLRNGLPIRYVERVVLELADHQQDLVERSADPSVVSTAHSKRTLGEMDNLSSAIVTGYREQTFAGRHPILTLVCGPLLFCHVMCFAYLVFTIAFGGLILPLFGIDFASETVRPGAVAYGVAAIAFDVLGLFPFVLTGLLTARLVRASGRGTRWLLAATAVQVFVALITMMAMELSSVPDANSGMHLHIGTEGFEDSVWIMLRQFLQAVIPVVIGIAVWLRSIRDRHLRECHSQTV